MSEYSRPLGLALLTILALGLAAATLASPTDLGGDQGDAASSNSSIDGQEFNETGDEYGSSWNLSVYENEDFCYEPLAELSIWSILAYVALLVTAVTTLLSNRYWGVALGAFSVGPTILIFIVLTAGCPGTLPGPQSAQEAASDTGGEIQQALEGLGPGTDGGISISTPLLFFGGLAVLAVFGLFASLFLFEEEPDEDSETSHEIDEEVTSVIGTIARETADEIQSDMEATNEIYWAWAEMAAALEVDHPERSTPEEFAAAAREAGLEPEDVDELTELFEAVRYGTADVTAERERQAVETLRRIQRQYADDESAGNEAGK